MKLPAEVVEYIEAFEKSGFSAYVVGGAVRDMLRGIEPSDYDVTTSAKVSDVKNIFYDHNIYDTGIKHGTVSVNFKGRIFETTTFRVDGEYNDNRHPSTVTFTNDLTSDLSRRDFTVNAMALDKNCQLIDPFGGRTDLENGVIKAVGTPEKRFKEDALRILRAMRFAAQTGFKVEEKTKKAAILCRALLSNVSKERIFEEFTKLLTANHAFNVLIDFKEVVFEIIPELKACDGFDQNNRAHLYDVYVHTLYALDKLDRRTAATCWAALLHDIAKPSCFVTGPDGVGHFPGHMEASAKIAQAVLERLKAPKELIKEVSFIVSIHDKGYYTKYAVKRFLNKYGADYFADFLTLTYADIYAHSDYAIEKYLPERLDITKYFKEIQEGDECYLLSQLKINGDDLKKLGFNGKNVGAKLDEILDLVMKEELKNDKETLLRFAEKN